MGGPFRQGVDGMSWALAMRRQQQVQEKSRIGAACAAMVSDGEAIILG